MNKFLFDNEICDAYQYISNARKTIGIALFCKELILSLISKWKPIILRGKMIYLVSFLTKKIK